jgi:hypothetical protein
MTESIIICALFGMAFIGAVSLVLVLSGHLIWVA